jgi:hypothetical protein
MDCSEARAAPRRDRRVRALSVSVRDRIGNTAGRESHRQRRMRTSGCRRYLMTRHVRSAFFIAALALLLLLTAMAVSLRRAATTAEEKVAEQEQAFAAQGDAANR